ncbi:MAG: hypothetical protein O3C40_25400 [Planctomycetota bacterium]|nr:hypothetical protein [Planctomycetota bacterium]
MVFGFFKRKPPEVPDDPPTEKQLRYAAKLGIVVKPGMSKWELSDAISAYEAKNPKAQRQREHIAARREAKKPEVEVPPELIEAECRWNEFSDSTVYMLAVYQKGKERIVDVLQVAGAELSDRNKLRLSLVAPVARKDRYTGDWLDWDKIFELPIEKLLYFEPLNAKFSDAGLDGYKKAVERGLKIAKKLK